MADKLQIRFHPDAKNKVTSLSAQVQQIISQKGAFRNVSYASLQEEIARSTSDQADNDDEDIHDASSDDEDQQARRDKLWKSRDEMLQKLSYAQNEILSALDFVSLLLSNHTAAASNTMSPALKELVPPKSLDGRIIGHQTPSTSQIERYSAVSEGWKAESFLQASAKLEAASSRLERQTERQSQYWQQIAHLQDRGWTVSRLPSDSRVIGAHFGSQESAPQFRAKGFAPLPQDDNGNVYLDSKSASNGTLLLEVAIFRKGIQTGSYAFPSTKHISASNVETELIAARDTLFNEELFYEISREARLIANQDVRTHPDAVEADIDHDYQIKLTRQESVTKNYASPSDEDSVLAQLIAYCFSFLLVAEHKRLHQRRTQPAPPMSLSSSSNGEYAILRPVLTQLRHEQRKIDITRVCQTFLPSFKSAGLPLIIDCVTHSDNIPSPEHGKFESFRSRLTSSVIIKMQGESKITIGLSTYLGSPSYGTSYEISATDFDFMSLKKERLDNIPELRTSLTDLLQLVLVAHVRSFVDLDAAGTVSQVKWVLVKPHTGEFVISRDTRNVAKVVLGIQSCCIALHSIQTSSESGHAAKKEAFLWRAGGLQSMPTEQVNSMKSETFNEIITRLSKSFSS